MFMLLFLLTGMIAVTSCTKDSLPEAKPDVVQSVMTLESPVDQTQARASRFCCPGCDIILTVDAYNNSIPQGTLYVLTEDNCVQATVAVTNEHPVQDTVRIRGWSDGPIYVYWWSQNEAGVPARLSQFEHDCPNSFSLASPISLTSTPPWQWNENNATELGEYLMCTPWEGGGPSN